MALPWECYQEAIQSKTDCCDVCKYSEPTRKGDYIIIVPISNDLVWQIHYELLVTSIPRNTARWEVHFEATASYLLQYLYDNINNKDIKREDDALVLEIDINYEDLDSVSETFKYLFEIINPIVIEYLNHFDIIDLSCRISKLIRDEKQKQPYPINVLSESYPDENANSRILAMLFKYTIYGEHSVFNSFKSMLNEMLNSGNGEVINIIDPEISVEASTSEKRRIDILVTDKNSKNAIIIENKIWGANDQSKQIDDYISYVHSLGYALNNIFVVYLTSDGTKTVSKDSLSWENREQLGGFLPMNFKYDIIQWLENKVLPDCRQKEFLLYSAVTQYVDFLKGIFNMRNTDKIVSQNIKKSVLDIIEVDDQNKQNMYDKIQDVIERLDLCKSLFSSYLDDLKAPAAKAITEFTQSYFEECGMNPSVDDCMGSKSGYIQIHLNNWPTQVHLEWYPISLEKLVKESSYRIGLHLEGTYRPYLKELEMLSELEKHLNDEFVDGIFIWGKSQNRKHDSALFEIEIPTSSGKSFINMNDGERNAYLIYVYSKLLAFIKSFDEIFMAKLNDVTQNA